MIQDQIKKDFIPVLKKLRIDQDKLEFEHPLDPTHGDFATNIAMRVKKKGFANPVDLASEIVNTWRSLGLPEWLASVKVAKPGFINITLSQKALSNLLLEVLKEKNKYGSSHIGQGKTVIVDYSSPNIARAFGIGHLRSTIIGQAIYNLYKFLGFKTIGVNHLGDWGTQFGKLIVAIKRWNKGKVQGLTVEKLEKLYVRFHRQAAKRPYLEDEAREWFKKLEEGDSEARKIWQTCVEVSLKEFKRIYDFLEVKIDYALGESFYEDKIEAVVKRAKREKVAVESEGAIVVELPELKMPPAMLIKSDGATTYEARDLAAIAYRKKRWKPDLYIYEVGSDQRLHFQQTFAAAAELGYGNPEQFVHVAHGLIRLPTGKLSTRAGKTVYLEKVLMEAIKRARQIIASSQTGRGLSKKEQEEIARAVGVGAVKYFDLSHHYSTDIIFDWEKMFILEGNSAPYLQYTYARAQSVLGKAGEQDLKKSFETWKFNKEEEMALLRTLYKFPEVVADAAKFYSPNLICSFLFDLAQKYNLFYNRLRILEPVPSSNKQPTASSAKGVREARLALTFATAQIIKNGLYLLGIEALERM